LNKNDAAAHSSKERSKQKEEIVLKYIRANPGSIARKIIDSINELSESSIKGCIGRLLKANKISVYKDDTFKNRNRYVVNEV